MPLTNFGAILNFAEQLEKEDLAFYTEAASASDSTVWRELFASLAKENKKNMALVQRTRRENVTEMILEPIRDFTRAPYQIKPEGLAGLESAAAMSLENRAIRYYRDAAEKMRALPEVARALKTLAKKRGRRLERIEGGEQ
jgi:rubrerythrin